MKYLTRLFLLILLAGCTNNSSNEKPPVAENNEAFVRNAHAMAYHAEEARIYLFGGANEKEVLGDLWILEETGWQRVVAKNEPPGRTFPCLIYDDKNHRLVLFAGSKVLFGKGPEPENLLNDTWQFKDGQWKEINVDEAPSPRAEASMVYDESRETIVLFGGYTIRDGEYIKLGDTWEFYENNWQLVSTSGPSERHGVSMAYDIEHKSAVLFGGSTVDRQYGESKGETWTWKGETWNKLSIEQPAGVFNAPMVHDERKKEFIRFGGWAGDGRINETWSLSNNKWTRIDTEVNPTSRNHSSMIYDEKNGKIILFGGHDGTYVFGDTWELDNKRWKKLLEADPIKRVKNGH